MIFVWDDGYGISVPKSYQTVKGSVSDALKGFQKKEGTNGIEIFKVKAWDYAGLCEAFEEGITRARRNHIPVLFHVEESTQPQGHSTSGSHERYKSPERLEWEREWDCLRKMREWLIANSLATDEELSEISAAAKHLAREERQEAFRMYTEPVKELVRRTLELVNPLLEEEDEASDPLRELARELSVNREPMRRDIVKLLTRTLLHFHGRGEADGARKWLEQLNRENYDNYNSFLYHEGPLSPLRIEEVPAVFREDSPSVNGYEILNRFFDQLFENDPRVIAFGEDLGRIGDVNQGFAGLQAKHGERRIFDTSIREVSIIGQGIGLAMRGLRPIAEIQYLDYLLYGLQPLSDDLATLHFRTVGSQSAPLIVRTRGQIGRAHV